MPELEDLRARLSGGDPNLAALEQGLGRYVAERQRLAQLCLDFETKGPSALDGVGRKEREMMLLLAKEVGAVSAEPAMRRFARWVEQMSLAA